MPSLVQQHCAPGGQATKLADTEIANYLDALSGWRRVGNEIEKTFAFKNYHETIAFVNATAFVSHREDHHPDMSVHYNKCVMRYSTHDAGGITLNDIICAAKMNALIDN